MSKVVFDGVGEQPELNRITAKKNYASSSQSHKMGATAMFNDILHHLAEEKYPELLNEVGGLVAVRQHPVYAFQKIPIEGTDQYTHKFIGLFTVGADKGDKNFFSFSDSEIKETAIRLEGVDHIKGVGFNYPWEVNGVKKIRYNAAKEALCIVTDSDPTNWIAIFEQSMAGVAETEAEIDAYLAEKWQPAFECAYYNNPLIVGVDMTLAEINANIEVFGNLRRSDYRPYSMCEFWIDGEYDVYYLDKETNRYEKNGINILTDLGIAEGEIAGLTIEEKNALFIQKRVERFREQAKEYFNITDSIYQLMFLFIILATDNFEKNMYPYLMALLWRFLQDDLDSIFSTDNQGLDTKKYSTELHDFTDNSKSAYVFKGEDSAFWQLIELAFPNECKQMGRDILQAMYDKASGGTTTTEKLLCFFDDYFFDRAQNYFTPSAYNDDTEYAYEEAWNNKEYVSSVDIHPLAQALGSHESTERAWLEKRIIYLQSKFSFGSFASSASDLGVISFRTQQAQSFTLTPAIDCYPTIVSGDGNVINAQQRVMAGESVTLEGAGGSNTNVYIVGADWLSDIGDLKGLALDPSAVQKLSISSKRLRRIKVGDEVASEVTSALQQLDIQRCDCLETIDARNLTSLVGVVDLSKCPRLSEAYFGGSSASAIVIAAGSKIEKLELPDTISVLDLRDTKFLQEINIGELANLNSLRLEGVPSLDGFEVLSNAYNAEGQKLQSIRLIGFTREGNSDDLNMLSNLANDKDKDGNEHLYNGIDAQGKPTDGHPVLEGTLNIDGYAYEDAVEAVSAAFPSIVFTLKGFYVRFADPEVQRIVVSNWGDGTGITTEQVKAITDIGTKFSGNTLIETFDEFEEFEGVSVLTKEGTFRNCSNLNSIKLPNTLTKTSWGYDFNGCTSLTDITFPDSLTYLGNWLFNGCTALDKDITGYFKNVTHIGCEAFHDAPIKGELALDNVENFVQNGSQFMNTKITKATIKGTVDNIPSDCFNGCTELADVVLGDNITILNKRAFKGCSSLRYLDLSKVKYVGGNVFEATPLGGTVDLSSLEQTEDGAIVLGDYAFSDNGVIDKLILPKTPIHVGAHTFGGTTVVKDVDNIEYIYRIDGDMFDSLEEEFEELTFPYLKVIGRYALDKLKVKKIIVKVMPNIGDGSLSGGDTGLGDPTYVETIDFSDVLSSVTKYGLLGYNTLQNLIFRSVEPPTMGTNYALKNTNNCPIYVPDASVESYQSATNWVSYKDRIKSIFYYLGYIEFDDAEVERICLENFDTDGDGKLSIEEAAAVTDIGTLFKGNTEIISFNEFKYFTGVTSVADRAFNKCSNLETINFPPSITGIGVGAFANTKVTRFDLSKSTVYDGGTSGVWNPIRTDVLYISLPNCEMPIASVWNIALRPATGCVIRFNPNTKFNTTNYHEVSFSWEATYTYEVDEQNTHYFTIDGALFEGETRLLDAPKGCTLTKIPETVVYLSKLALSYSTNNFLVDTEYGKTFVVDSNIQFANYALYQTSSTIDCLYIKTGALSTDTSGTGSRSFGKEFPKVYIEDGDTKIAISKYCSNTTELIHLGRPITLYWEDIYLSSELFVVPEGSDTIFNGCCIDNCPNLKTFKFHTGLEKINSYGFRNCPNLVAIIFPSVNVISLTHTDLLDDTITNAYFYVPDDLVDDYKAATNWNAYANQIKPLSEYVES